MFEDTMTIKRSRQELSIYMVIHGGIFKNNQIKFFSCFAFMSKTGFTFYHAVVWVQASSLRGGKAKRGRRHLNVG